MTDELELTVVGSSGAIPRPGRACSSYLFRRGADSVVLDMGTGAYAVLARHMRPADVGAVCISHFHADHFFDVVPFRYALRYGGARPRERVPLYIPPGGTAVLHAVAAAVSAESPRFFEEVFDVREFGEDPIVVGDIVIRPTAVRHFIPAFAFRVEAGERACAYSADSTYADEIVACARGADYFICEATLGPEGVEAGERGHSSARDAGRMAREAGARALGLTHYGAQFDPSDLRAAAALEFAGPIDVLDDGARRRLATVAPSVVF